MLALPVVVRGMVRLGIARCDFIEGIEGTDAFTGGKVLDPERSLGQVGDALSETLCAGSQPREITRPGGDYLELLDRLDGRRSFNDNFLLYDFFDNLGLFLVADDIATYRAGNKADAARQHFTTFHGILSFKQSRERSLTGRREKQANTSRQGKTLHASPASRELTSRHSQGP